MSVFPVQDLTVNLNVCQVVQRMTQFEKRQMETLVGFTLAEMFWIQRHLVTSHHLLIMICSTLQETQAQLYLCSLNLSAVCLFHLSTW